MVSGRRPWRIRDFTYAEIKRLDAGSWFHSGFKGVRVPALDQVLDTLEDGSAGLLLEVKSPATYPEIGARVAAHLARRALRWSIDDRPIMVCSFDWHFIKLFKPLMPTVKVAVIGTPDYDVLPVVAAYADLVNPKFGTVSTRYLKRVHDLGMESYVWTVDDPDDMREVITVGADGVVSNKPDVLDDVLGRERTGVA